MAEDQKRPHRLQLDSLATRLILFVFLSTFATAVVVSSVAIQATYQHVREGVDRELPAAGAGVRDAIEAWVAVRAEELSELARATRAVPAAELALPENGRFSSLARIAPTGEVRAAVGLPLPQLRRRAAPVLGLQSLATVHGSDAVALSVPVDPDEPDGDRLVGILPEPRVRDFIAGLATAPGRAVFLVDAQGHVLFRQGGTEASLALAPLGLSGDHGVSEYTNPAGTLVVGSALPVRMSDWAVVVESPFAIVFAPVVSMVERIAVIDVCIIALFSLLAWKITTAILRPIENLSDGARRIAEGQLDHEIPVPAKRDEIGLLTRTFNDMMRELRGNHTEIASTNTQLLEKNIELQRANEVLEQLSITDGLTKLHNHRYFQEHLTREIKRVDRVQDPLSMILVDVDDFKSLNDRLGHAAGDELLRRIAALINASVRETDLAARYGGDEFVVLAIDTDLEGAQRVAEKIRMAVSESSFIVDESLRPARTTLSMGVAQYFGTRRRFFSAADRALYRAKAQGKNCVVFADPDE